MPFDLKEAPEWLKTLASANEEKQRKANEVQRLALAKEDAALSAERAQELPALRKAIDEAVAAEEAARRAHAEARDRLARARAADYGASLGYDHRHRRIVNQMRELADPRIDAALTELHELLQRDQRRQPLTGGQDTGESTMSGKRVVDLLSERPSLLARLDVIRSAIDQVDHLKEECVADVATAIAEILSTIPEVTMEVVAKRMVRADSGEWVKVRG